MDDWTRGAFERLLALAQSDTGQSRRAANFILAWTLPSLRTWARSLPGSPGRTTPLTQPNTAPRSSS